jgi:hypothetical protein
MTLLLRQHGTALSLKIETGTVALAIQQESHYKQYLHPEHNDSLAWLTLQIQISAWYEIPIRIHDSIDT